MPGCTVVVEGGRHVDEVWHVQVAENAAQLKDAVVTGAEGTAEAAKERLTSQVKSAVSDATKEMLGNGDKK